jgi:hypothetical protein
MTVFRSRIHPNRTNEPSFISLVQMDVNQLKFMGEHMPFDTCIPPPRESIPAC